MAFYLQYTTAGIEMFRWPDPILRPTKGDGYPRCRRVAQTFCLVATWLGLAPFCSMALADSRIEADLGIDGVSESVLYAAGVGTLPHGLKWAPWPTRFQGTRHPNPSFAQP